MKNTSVLYLLFCLVFLSISPSCTKDELTKPANVKFNMELAKDEVNMRTDGSKKTTVKIHKARYKFSEMEFEGYRQGSPDYFFTKEFDKDFEVVVEEGKAASISNFDMPQGVYDRINISLKVKKRTETLAAENEEKLQPIADPYNADAAVILEGYYTNTQLETFPLIFLYNYDEVFEHRASSGNNSSTISISKSASNVATIIFDPSYWMQLINARMLQGAKLTLVNGTPTIILSEESNENIFNLLTSRIKNASELKFQ